MKEFAFCSSKSLPTYPPLFLQDTIASQNFAPIAIYIALQVVNEFMTTLGLPSCAMAFNCPPLRPAQMTLSTMGRLYRTLQRKDHQLARYIVRG